MQRYSEFIIELRQLLTSDRLSEENDVLEDYSHDWTEDLQFMPAVVVFPESTAEVSEILKLCHQYEIPVTPAGARTGLSGGALPVYGGLVLATSRMQQILEIDTQNLQCTVQPGVITEVLQKAVESEGLYYPPDPSSKGSCFIGGNLAESAGGIRAVKYGLTRDYVLSLTAVLMDGSIIHTGARVLKNATGYNLTQLLIGSEGTLAVITEAVLKLVPAPKARMVLMISFEDWFQACHAVSAIFRAGITPSALEFMERDAVLFGMQYLGIHKTLPPQVQAQLLVEVDGQHSEVLMAECETISRVAESFGAGDILVAQTAQEQDEIFRIRRCLGVAVKGTTIYKEEDTVVPRAALASLLAMVKATGSKYGFTSICYGHAGDGNLHINIIRSEAMSDAYWHDTLPLAIREIFEYTVSLGGTLSGEHGIGWVQKAYFDIAIQETEIRLMQDIKKVFDPKGLLNPGKIWK
jgi:glycolate oxidase